MSEYKTDGHVISNGDGYMGIFSAVNLLNDKCKEIDKLKTENEKLRECVEFYADKEKWVIAEYKWNDASDDSIFNSYDHDDEEFIEGFGHCGGQLARQTLKELEGISKTIVEKEEK